MTMKKEERITTAGRRGVTLAHSKFTPHHFLMVQIPDGFVLDFVTVFVLGYALLIAFIAGRPA